MPEDLGSRLARRTLFAVPDAELLLRAAAVLPGGFSVEELAAMLDQPLTDVLATTLAAAEASVLADNGAALAFRHDLLRRAVLDATPASIVRSLHRRAADVLTQPGADPERITACLLAGCDPCDPADHDRLVTVGRAMIDRNHGAAADLLASALEGTVPASPASTGRALELGWALVAAGRAGDARPARHRSRALPPGGLGRRWPKPTRGCSLPRRQTSGSACSGRTRSARSSPPPAGSRRTPTNGSIAPTSSPSTASSGATGLRMRTRS
jgi:hypothetical protein